MRDITDTLPKGALLDHSIYKFPQISPTAHHANRVFIRAYTLYITMCVPFYLGQWL